MSENLARFRDRADDYAKHRPSYPAALFMEPGLSALFTRTELAADVGAGTGLFTRQLAAVVRKIVAIEPEPAMCAEASAFLRDHANIEVRQGRAEATGLAAASVDLVTVAQAFHWFDRATFRTEARRILRPGGAVLIVRNQRCKDDPFMQDYETSIRQHEVRPAVRATEAEITAFFPAGCATCVVPWSEDIDHATFLGRVRSNSTMPRPDHPAYAGMTAEVDRLFIRWQRDGQVRYAYQCQAWWGAP